MIHAITVCVNYEDFLSITLPINLTWASTFTIVTIPECEEKVNAVVDIYRKAIFDSKITVVVSTRLHEGGSVFAKSRLINDGLFSVHSKFNPHEDWICHIDADTFVSSEILSPEFSRYRIGFDDIILGAVRYMVDSREQLMKYCYIEDGVYIIDYGRIMKECKCDRWVAGGFFQMWNRVKQYSQVSGDASADDMIFRSSFKKFAAMVIPVVHLGTTCSNWNGRITPLWR